jgi:hypothetical protein
MFTDEAAAFEYRGMVTDGTAAALARDGRAAVLATGGGAVL